MSDTSVYRRNGRLLLGKATTGPVINLLIKVLKVVTLSSVHVKGSLFLIRMWRDLAMSAKPFTNLRY